MNLGADVFVKILVRNRTGKPIQMISGTVHLHDITGNYLGYLDFEPDVNIAANSVGWIDGKGGGTALQENDRILTLDPRSVRIDVISLNLMFGHGEVRKDEILGVVSKATPKH